MKIMHIVEGFGGGVYSFLVDLCNSQAEKHEVTLIYSLRPQTPKDFKNDFDNRIRLVHVDMARNIDINKDVSSLFKIMNLLKQVRPDVVHLHSSKAGVLGRIATKLYRYKDDKVFYNPHGYAFLQSNISEKKQKFYLFIEKIFGKIIGHTVAVSKGEYNEGKKITENIIRIDNAVNCEILDKYIGRQKTNKEIVLGTIGRISYQKNPGMFNQIAKRFPNVTFLWIGDGELRDELTSSNIEITGWKDRYSAIQAMNDIDVYIQTSLWEGMPIALLEAMYIGKVPVVSNVIGNNDVVMQNMNGFLANDLEEYIIFIKRLIADKNYLTKFSNKAKNYIKENHSLIGMVEKYDKLYEGFR